MSIFHKPIRRTFHRKARNGNVKANGHKYFVSKDGRPYTGEVTIYTHGGGSVFVKGDPFGRLETVKLGQYREVGISRS